MIIHKNYLKVSHNNKLFEQRKKDGKWSTDYVRFSIFLKKTSKSINPD